MISKEIAKRPRGISEQRGQMNFPNKNAENIVQVRPKIEKLRINSEFKYKSKTRKENLDQQ